MDPIGTDIVDRQRRSAKQLLIHAEGVMQGVGGAKVGRRRIRLKATGRDASSTRGYILRCACCTWTCNLRLNLIHAVRFDGRYDVSQHVPVIENSKPAIENGFRVAGCLAQPITNRNTRSNVVVVRQMVLSLISYAVFCLKKNHGEEQ